MAGNKFATMLHKHTNKTIVILMYALLEWILILLLLLNSLFNYLITKFAQYFALKHPCTLCSSLDRLFDHDAQSYKDRICHTHATEISKLGYCSNHNKLAESHKMCLNCLSSTASHSHNGNVQQIGYVSLASGGNGEESFCSCCNEKLSSCGIYPNYSAFKPSWRILDYTKKGGLVVELLNDEKSNESDQCKETDKSYSLLNYEEEEDDDRDRILSAGEDYSNLQSDEKESPSEDGKEGIIFNTENYVVGTKFVDQFADDDIIIECTRQDDSMDIIENSLEKYVAYSPERLIPIELIDASTNASQPLRDFKNVNLEKQDCFNGTSDSALVVHSDKNMDIMMEIALQTAEVSKHDSVNVESYIEESKINEQNNDPAKDQSSAVDNDAQISSAATLCIEPDDIGVKQTETTDKDQQVINHDSATRSEPYEAEEEKFPDTPTALDNLHYLSKKQLISEKRESVTEDSLDGSVATEIEGSDSIERLKTVLKSEQKALSSLYAELDEERSASAVSTSQTMAMINRLQEEKAAMQMEALQYQRMMEEQAEYDQEALQLMNELMVKREKEKQELEKELEIFRHKCLEYETKEKIRKMRRQREYCASKSDEEYSEELSIDLNREATYGERNDVISPDEAVLDLEEAALDCVKHITNLDDSLEEFEEERMSILDQIKALEEKILILSNGEVIEDNEYSEKKDSTLSSMVKNLLPLLDEADYETEENSSNEEKVKLESVKMQECLDSKFKEVDEENNEIDDDEVDGVYERLQALEADREFLTHCMSSMNQGEKGLDLLQEILQHLRDLKAVELTDDSDALQ